MSDEQTIRDALDRYYLPRTAAHAALDRLVARLRDAESVPFSGTVTRLLQRAEAAEKERDEALDSVVLYVNERDEAVRLYGMEANAVVLYVNERDEAVRLYGMEANERRSAEARANNLAPYVKRSQAAEARCATLEAALVDDPEGMARRFHEAYERLAPGFGYETRKESAVPWEDVPEQNRALMVAVCAEIGSALAAASQPAEEESWGSMDLLTGGTAQPAEKEGT